ncbi:DgyrCDS6387 [Dimorphilus gyrociliatus]|uniref:DgyrCDS6387 n=1 Tax=Dimorphilus gyrociliatus TaxID=2664684 RepID=A0A7I8VPH3_9ANNE|nr:DgyrCDS6387 [Dimorphilus gyrociliatus]
MYEDEWRVEDEINRRFSLQLSDIGGQQDQSVTLYVNLPEEYPSSCPPTYEISKNKGDCILYLWIDKVKSFFEELQQNDLMSLKIDDSIKNDDLQTVAKNDLDCEKNIQPCPEIFHGEPFTERKSTFQAHIAEIRDVHQVSLVVQTLRQNKKIDNATHNMFAYRLRRDDGVLVSDCDDDGETHAGSRLLHLLEVMKVVNLIVIVTRWYGGIHLGPDRFKHINNAARFLLESLGFDKSKVEKFCKTTTQKKR